MNTNDLTKYLKTAFEHKNNGDYKKSIDYFYKALTLDNESCEIMKELAYLYAKLSGYERAVSFYEQILLKEPENNIVKFEFAKLLQTIKEEKKAEELLLDLYDKGFDINNIAEVLFSTYFSRGDYENIANNFNKYSNIINNSKVLYLAAGAFSKIGKESIAEDLYQKAYENDKENVFAGIKTVEYLFKNGKIDDAENLALKLLKHTENAEIFYLLAEIAYSKSDIDLSIEYYSCAIKMNSQNANYFFKLAIAYSLKGFFNEAKICCVKAIELEPENETYNYALAYLYYTDKENELSEKQTDYILAYNPDNFQAICLKTLLLLEKNEMGEIKRFIDKVLNYEEKDDFAYYVLSIYYSKLNLLENAISSIEKAIDLNSSSIEYKYQSALLYYMLKNYEKSTDICEKIIIENKKYLQAYILMSKIKYMIKDYDSAKNYINKVLDLDKNQPEVYYVSANIHYDCNDYENALKDYKIAASINPNREEYYVKIAECLYKLQNYKDAYLYYKEATNFDITNVSYRYYMAKCSVFNNDRENAISNFSVMKRLAPLNIDYIQEYAEYVYECGNKKAAISILESSLRNIQNPKEKEIIEKNIKRMKK